MATHDLTHNWLIIKILNVSNNWYLNVIRFTILNYQLTEVNRDYETKTATIKVKTITFLPLKKENLQYFFVLQNKEQPNEIQDINRNVVFSL